MTLLYDGTYEGLMTVIFDCYDRKIEPTLIAKTHRYQPGMFDQRLEITSDLVKAKKVVVAAPGSKW